MASIDGRLKKLEAETLARQDAEREAVISAWVDWIGTGTPEEQDAYLAVLAWHVAGKPAELEPAGDIQALAAAHDARAPADMVTRLTAAFA